MKRRLLLPAVMSLIAIVGTACGGAEESSFAATETSAPSASPTEAPTTSSYQGGGSSDSSPSSSPTSTSTYSSSSSSDSDDSDSSNSSGSEDSTDSDDSDDSDSSDSESNAPGSDGRVVLKGTASVVIDYYDWCDVTSTSRRFLGSRTYSKDVTLVAWPRQQDDDGNEDPNPMSLNIASDGQGGEGDFGVTSALHGTSTRTGEDMLLRYWSLSWSDGKLSGTLRETQASGQVAHNLLSSFKPTVGCRNFGSSRYAYAMDEGATLRGTLDEDSSSLRLRGHTKDKTREFLVKIEVSDD